MAAVALAIGALSLAAVSTYNSYEAGKDMKKANDRAYQQQLLAQNEQRKIANEQKASNAASAANERRNQLREERIRRAKIMQAAENGGVAGGSGESGALGSLGTNLGVNLGNNLSAIAASNRVSGYNNNISIFNQNAAGFSFQAQQAGIDKQNSQALAGLGMSIFSAAGGFGAFKSAGASNTASFGSGGMNGFGDSFSTSYGE